LIEAYLEGQSKENYNDMLLTINAIRNHMRQDVAFTRAWPKDSFQWMSSNCWELGMYFVSHNHTGLGEQFFATAINLTALDETSQGRLVEMNRTMDEYQRQKEASTKQVKTEEASM
jgi:hypothetical protein